MGAIVAVLSSSETDTTVATQMLAAAPHRGTDMAVRVRGKCILGVSNDSVMDSSISITNEGTIAVFSGNLDNSHQLGRKLADCGFRAATEAPADVVVSAFRAFGADAPNHMRGVFAGVVTDGYRVWAFRDHIGFKPLFYRYDQKGLFIATEAKQLVAGARLLREPDLDVLEQIFYGRMADDTPCAIKGVLRLPQSTTLIAEHEKPPELYRYHSPEALLETADLKPTMVAECFSEMMRCAMARSLTGRDLLLLSGGVDSPTIAAYGAQQHRELSGRPLGALTATFPALPRVDELRYVKLIADYLGLDLYTHRPEARALDDLTRWCELLDGPVPTVSVPEINESYAFARKLGFQRILTGEAAEFVFDQRMHLLGHLLWHRRFGSLARLFSAERRRGRSPRRALPQLLEALTPGWLANWYLNIAGLDWPQRIPEWLDARKVNEVPFRADLVPPIRSRWTAQQLLPFGGSTITMEADELCAALNQVTVRRPFADIDLWEFFLSLRAETKFPDLGTKTLVRKLLRGKLPDEILDRRDKTVFDDHVMAQIDYPTLRRFLTAPQYRMKGVNYSLLNRRIERKDFSLIDWFWANDLARIHAFLSLW